MARMNEWSSVFLYNFLCQWRPLYTSSLMLMQLLQVEALLWWPTMDEFYSIAWRLHDWPVTKLNFQKDERNFGIEIITCIELCQWHHSKTGHSTCDWTTVMPCWLVFQLPHWLHLSESCILWHVLFWILSRATVWLRLSKSCTDYQSQRGSWTRTGLHLGLADTSRRYTRTICTVCLILWRPHYATDMSTNQRQSFLCCFQMHGTDCPQTWSCCSWQTNFVENWKHFCLSLYSDTKEHAGLFCDAPLV